MDISIGGNSTKNRELKLEKTDNTEPAVNSILKLKIDHSQNLAKTTNNTSPSQQQQLAKPTQATIQNLMEIATSTNNSNLNSIKQDIKVEPDKLLPNLMQIPIALTQNLTTISKSNSNDNNYQLPKLMDISTSINKHTSNNTANKYVTIHRSTFND